MKGTPQAAWTIPGKESSFSEGGACSEVVRTVEEKGDTSLREKKRHQALTGPPLQPPDWSCSMLSDDLPRSFSTQLLGYLSKRHI